MQFIRSWLLLVPALVSGQDCIAGNGREPFDMYMPYHEKSVTVPTIPLGLGSYSYAGDKALVSVPAKCYEQFQAQLGYTANIDDRQPGGPQGMFLFRVSDPDTEYAMLGEMAASECSCGLVLLVHGTSGVRWQSASYMMMMAGLGYVAIAPDSQAMPVEMGLKGANSIKKTEDIATTNYCGALDTYSSRCGDWERPFCYSTKADNILYDSAKYREYVERNYLIRKLELDSFIEARMADLKVFSRIFMFGRSEGAMTAARYYNNDLHGVLAGLILSGWSCEFNYFTSCAENAKVCGDKCSNDIPVLNVNGQADSFFGADDSSVSSMVAANTTHGYGGTITGNCRSAFNAQGFSKSTVVDFAGVGHSIMYSHDNALRSIVADFLYDPESNSAKWDSLRREGCSLTNGVYSCDADLIDDEPPCVSYVVNPAAQWNFRGRVGTCATSMTCRDVKDAYRANECCGRPSKPMSWAPSTRRLKAAPSSATLQKEMSKLLEEQFED